MPQGPKQGGFWFQWPEGYHAEPDFFFISAFCLVGFIPNQAVPTYTHKSGCGSKFHIQVPPRPGRRVYLFQLFTQRIIMGLFRCGGHPSVHTCSRGEEDVMGVQERDVGCGWLGTQW